MKLVDVAVSFDTLSRRERMALLRKARKEFLKQAQEYLRAGPQPSLAELVTWRRSLNRKIRMLKAKSVV